MIRGWVPLVAVPTSAVSLLHHFTIPPANHAPWEGVLHLVHSPRRHANLTKATLQAVGTILVEPGWHGGNRLAARSVSGLVMFRS